MRVVAGVALAIVLACPRISTAQAAPDPPVPPRAFVEAGLIGTFSSVSKDRVFTSRFVVFGEPGSSQATYPKPSRVTLFPAIDIGAGYMAGPLIGLGVNVSRVSFEDGASLATTVPHPIVLNAPASATGVTDDVLARDETTLSAFVVAVPIRTTRTELRVFGGPTYFRLNAEMVQRVLHTQQASVAPLSNVITVTGVATEEVKGNGLGFHLGGDVAYFLTRMIGVRAGVRFSQGHVTVIEPLSKLEQRLKVGGSMVFLGVRFRFGD